MSSEMHEFGFDDASVIKNNAVELFKQSKPGEKTRISIVSFKKHSDKTLADKAKEKGSPLSDEEKAGYLTKIDARLSELLGKPVDAITEIDRLDIKAPRLGFKWTHYRDGVGTICCYSDYNGKTCTRPDVCCKKLGEAEQQVGMIVMTYPVKDGVQVDEELLAQKKYVNFYIWRMSAKKYNKVLDAYKEAKGDDRHTIDLIVTLDGDPKYQKQQIVPGSNAVWARGAATSETRNWVLDQGLRLWKHVPNNLGFDMKMDKLLEKLGMAPQALGSGAESAESPKLQSSYDSLIS